MQRILSALSNGFPFILIGCAILLAFACPWLACSYCNAPLHPELSIWWGVIPGIFLAEGFLTPNILSEVGRVKEHLLVQGFNFIAIPLVTLLAALYFHSLGILPGELLEGFIAFSTVPTTTSMNMMHTGLARGNVPLACFNAIVGNSLAVIVSPLWLLLVRLPGEEVDRVALLVAFMGKMMLPLLLGWCLQKNAPFSIERSKVICANQIFIAALILQIFSDVFYHGEELPLAWAVSTIGLAVLFHAGFLALAWALVSLSALKLPMKDRVAMLFCSTQKTVVLGLPLLRTVLWMRTPSQLVVLSFPLIIYHLLQLGVGLLLARFLRPHVEAESAARTGEGDSASAALQKPLVSGEEG